MSELEVFDLKALRGHHIVSVLVGVVSLAVALWAPLRFAPFSPMCLALMGPGHGLWARTHNRRRQALEMLLAGPAAAELT